MSQQLINRSPDLKRLRDEGYEIQVLDNHLLVNSVPYVTSQKEIKLGTLVIPLTISGDQAGMPPTHVVSFKGEYPCNKTGQPIAGIKHNSSVRDLSPRIQVNHSFSNKPKGGYKNYYDQVVNYVKIISHQAMSLDPDVDPKTFKIVDPEDPHSIFQYPDTNSSRAGILDHSEKFNGCKIGIVGLGGTGAYILDHVSKTPVDEIHLFDGDFFSTHNAFRAPGAAAITDINEKIMKTDYYCKIYSKMHKGIISHSVFINDRNLSSLIDLDFIFISIDSGNAKKIIIEFLLEHSIPFVETGIGVYLSEKEELFGQVRTTYGNEVKNDHLKKRIPFGEDEDNLYASNIQVAELNNLNAVQAVIKWKKHIGFYQDLDGESTTIYTLNDNSIINDDQA